MEGIITALGGTTGYYSEKLNCCGAPLMVTHKESAYTKASEKLKAVKERGFEALSIVCPLGGNLLDSDQWKASEVSGEKLAFPVLYLTQLIGMAMDKDPGKLGLDLNRSPVGRLIE
jgi:heterodisulfide reductase subunit B